MIPIPMLRFVVIIVLALYLSCVMALVLRNFANSNTAMLMPRRTATVLLRVVPPWVHQNPQHFPVAIAAPAPCTTLMYASIVTKELKKKNFFLPKLQDWRNEIKGFHL